MKRLSSILFFVLSGMLITILLGNTALSSGEKQASVQLFFTSDLLGYLKPCG